MTVLIIGWLLFALCLGGFIHLYALTDYAQPVDVIIVLGAGVQRNGRAGPSLTRRATHAAELWQAGVAPRILCTGGQTDRAPRTEADACREVLLSRGVPENAIIVEENSRSTEENAINSHTIMRDNGWQTAVIVSESYHVFRASWIFSLEGLTVYSSPVPASQAPFSFYIYSLAREVVALHWQAFKELFNLPQTYVGGM